MAISKQQPMRPAEIALVDASNQHERTLQAHNQSLNTLAGNLANETSDREAADIALNTSINNEIQARTNGDAALQGQIGEGFSPTLTIKQSLNTLTGNLTTETSNREAADIALNTSINNEIQARTNGDAALQGQLSATNASISDIDSTIGNGFDSENTVTSYAQTLDSFLGTRTELDDTVVNSILSLASTSESLESFASRFKIGCVNNITIPATDSVSTSETFAVPFAQDDKCVLFAQVITNNPANLLTYSLVACTYSGFSYSIANSDAEAHTVSLGYIAVKVN